MLLTGTCVIVGLIIVYMAVDLTKDQVSMTEVIESMVNHVEDVDK